MMATSPENRLLTGTAAPENFTSVSLTGNGFQFLGVEPVLGRTILPSDIKSNGEPEPVIVLSYRAWQRLFQGSPDALGKTVTLNDTPYSVIGVMPPRFGWWTSDGGWLALRLDPRQERPIFPIARLRAGVTPSVAEQQLHAIHMELAKAHPADFPKEGFTTVLRNYMDITVASGEMESSLRLLVGAVGFLLLIACANVANLQMARATSRRREIALRMSVGAGRARVLRQLLTESVMLSLAGGALGILLALGLTKGIVLLMPDFYVPNEARIAVNGYVLAFSAGVSVLTGILFGLVPALECSRLQLVETAEGRDQGLRHQRRRRAAAKSPRDRGGRIGGRAVDGRQPHRPRICEPAAHGPRVPARPRPHGRPAGGAETLRHLPAAHCVYRKRAAARAQYSRRPVGRHRKWRTALRRTAIVVRHRGPA